MSQPNILPHIYYSISELSLVKDVRVLKNLNVKTIAYIQNDRAYAVDFDKQTCEKKDLSVKVDLEHIINDISEAKPQVVFGILYTLRQSPVVSVKNVKEFTGDAADLITYHNLMLEIRKRNIYFETLDKKIE